jgi:hypothetical protein
VGSLRGNLELKQREPFLLRLICVEIQGVGKQRLGGPGGTSLARLDIPACSLSNQAFPFPNTDITGNRPARGRCVRETPEIGKVATLLRFDGLDCAIAIMEKDTNPIGLILQRQTASVGA